MFNRYLTYYPAATQFVIFCALLSMGFLLGGFFFDMSIHRILHMKSEDVQTMTEFTPAVASSLRWILPVSNMLILLLPALVFSYLAFPQPGQYLGIQKPNKILMVVIAMLWFVCSMPFSSWLETWNANLPWIQQFEKSSEHVDRLGNAMLSLHGRGDLLPNVLFMAFLPALLEEIFFRGCLQQIFMNWFGKHDYVVIVFVALIFSAFHMQMSAFFPRFFLGLLLGFTYYFSGNLWNNILIHFLNNALIVVLFNLHLNGTIPLDITQLPNVPWYLALGSAVSCVALGWWFFKNRKPFEVFRLQEEININSES